MLGNVFEKVGTGHSEASMLHCGYFGWGTTKSPFAADHRNPWPGMNETEIIIMRYIYIYNNTL